MRYFLTVCIFFLSVALSGCVHMLEEKNYQKFLKGEKGVVLFTVSKPYTKAPNGTISKKETRSFVLHKIKDKAHKDNSYRQYISGVCREDCYVENILFLDPGLYYIDEITVDHGWGVVYTLPSPGYKDHHVMYGAFEVKAGEVIGLGNLVVNRDSEKMLSFMREDDQIKKELQASKYHDMASKIVPGSFYESGSIIEIKDSGKKVIIPRALIDALLYEARQKALTQKERERGE
jgi:hypothetical protein